MKNKLNKKSVALVIFILIIISGIITVGVAGFEKSSDYAKGTRLEVYIPKGYEKQDVINIAKESFENKEISFYEIEKLNQVAGIKVKKYTKDELDNFKTKIAEKYEMDKKEIELHEVSVPTTRISSIVTPYVLPMILVTGLSLIYVGIRNFKSNERLKILLKVLATITIVIGLYFSIIALFRLPFGIYTMPLALAIYVITLLISVKNSRK